jgi:hypothetical protein
MAVTLGFARPCSLLPKRTKGRCQSLLCPQGGFDWGRGGAYFKRTPKHAIEKTEKGNAEGGADPDFI